MTKHLFHCCYYPNVPSIGPTEPILTVLKLIFNTSTFNMSSSFHHQFSVSIMSSLISCPSSFRPCISSVFVFIIILFIATSLRMSFSKTSFCLLPYLHSSQAYMYVFVLHSHVFTLSCHQRFPHHKSMYLL